MQISSLATYGLTPTSSLAGGSGAVSSASADGASQDSSIVQEFLNYARMSPIQARAYSLKASSLPGSISYRMKQVNMGTPSPSGSKDRACPAKRGLARP